MGHSGSRGGWRGTGGRRGWTDWGRLTCDRNTWARVTCRLRRVLRDNRSLLLGYRRVSNRRGFFRFWIYGIFRGILGMLTLGVGSKISLVPFSTSQQTTLLVEGVFTCKHRLVILNLTVWFKEQYIFSANSILIRKLNEFKNLPLGPLKNCRSASLKEVLVSMANSVTNA